MPKICPVHMAHRVARLKKNSSIRLRAKKHMTSGPTQATPRTASASSISARATKFGPTIKPRPDRKLVKNSPSRRMGRLCISPTERLLHR